MSLRTYKKKRNFKKTREPAARVKKGRAGFGYVIQKHAATRLHYDFRLELDGALKSWAVPKGPSYDPGERRLAVHVEDHPLDYATFEGTIPKGQYGGGTVMVWDRGTWEPIDDDPAAAYANGKLKFLLHGKKLVGGWTLVRMKGRDDDSKDNWLLIKERDDSADPGRDITEDAPDSAVTERSLEEIADAKAKVWKSNRKQDAVRARRVAAPKNTKRLPAKAVKIDAAGIPDAAKRAQPVSIKPQLCTLVKEVPEGDAWLHESKFDGYRVVAFVKKGKTRLMSRNGKDWTRRFPAIEGACAALGHDCVLDGEAVVLREDGTSDFQALQNLLRAERTPNVAYIVFDLLHLDGYDLTDAPLTDRKAALRTLLRALPKNSPIQYSDHIEGQGPAVFQNACRLAMEGVISKRADSPYLQKRSAHWLKIKCIKSQEFVIGGYSPPSGARSEFGALFLGYHDEVGGLVFAGKVGTGFTEDSLRTVAAELHKRERQECPFESPPAGREARNARWVTPTLVCEVEFIEWTSDGRLRHPSFKGLRDDKPARKIVRERPVTNGVSAKGERAMPTKKQKSGRARTNGSTAKTAASRSNDSTTINGVAISHPDKLLYPEGITKRDLVEYYDRMADRILPYIAHRPLTLVRCPQGRAQKCFYQKHLTEGMPEHVRGISIREKEGKADYIVIDSHKALLELANLGVLEFHVWGCHEDKVEQPDMLVFDLDPGPDVKPARLTEAAFLMHDLFKALGLRTFVKTTGGKGLHVVAPIQRRHSWSELKELTRLIAVQIAAEAPKRYTANMSLGKRTGKIYLDYLRNGRGATFIAPYSTRARPNAPVSMPLHWDELDGGINPAHWTIENAEAALKGRKDPWAEFSKTRQSLTAALKHLRVEA